jgi:WD40 repeat protein
LRSSTLASIKASSSIVCTTSLASGNHAGILQLWDVATGQERFVLAQHNSEIGTLAFSPDGTTLATGTWDGKIWLYRAAARETAEAAVATRRPAIREPVTTGMLVFGVLLGLRRTGRPD